LRGPRFGREKVRTLVGCDVTLLPRWWDFETARLLARALAMFATAPADPHNSAMMRSESRSANATKVIVGKIPAGGNVELPATNRLLTPCTRQSRLTTPSFGESCMRVVPM
jgi:hypothetical protein